MIVVYFSYFLFLSMMFPFTSPWSLLSARILWHSIWIIWECASIVRINSCHTRNVCVHVLVQQVEGILTLCQIIWRRFCNMIIECTHDLRKVSTSFEKLTWLNKTESKSSNSNRWTPQTWQFNFCLKSNSCDGRTLSLVDHIMYIWSHLQGLNHISNLATLAWEHNARKTCFKVSVCGLVQISLCSSLGVFSFPEIICCNVCHMHTRNHICYSQFNI